MLIFFQTDQNQKDSEKNIFDFSFQISENSFVIFWFFFSFFHENKKNSKNE